MITWEAQSRADDNANNFASIAGWWQALDGKPLRWQQRLIPEDGDIDWAAQRFDETFQCQTPDVRGITLYWTKQGESTEKSTTPAKMEFSPIQQRLLVYPESQAELVIGIEVAEAAREIVRLRSPEWRAERLTDDGGQPAGCQLIVHDNDTRLDIQVDMNADSLADLKHLLATL